MVEAEANSWGGETAAPCGKQIALVAQASDGELSRGLEPVLQVWSTRSRGALLETLGGRSPDLLVIDVDRLEGGSVDIADLYGRQPVVLEFWATWCPLCRKLEPSMQAARAKYAGKVTFVSVGVAANQTAEKQKAYVDDKKLTGVFTFDRTGAAMKAFAVPHTSYIVVVGADRRVVYTGVGDDQDVDAVLAKLGNH